MTPDRIHWAIEHDTARHNDLAVPSLAKVPSKWLDVMRAVLRLPVPRRGGAVRGEVRYYSLDFNDDAVRFVDECHGEINS